jgi:peptidyl-prolyl cis-trans isomerase B (cyclophilin B)
MPKQPDMQVDLDTIYQVTIETDRGPIVMELDPKLAPKSVNHFVVLARDGFYDGLTFHRVVPDFVIQGGDPFTRYDDMKSRWGTGGPGFKIKDELSGKKQKHERGSLSMAHAGPGTGGSQFFICHSGPSHLDRKHTVFGKVISGIEVVDQIREGDKMKKVWVE